MAHHPTSTTANPDLPSHINQISPNNIAKTFNTNSIDLLNPHLGTRILRTSNEFFCPATNLTTPHPPIHKPHTFTDKGAWYDGWETRRHNPSPPDFVVFRLGVFAATVSGVEVDTGFFSGNHAPEISVEGCYRRSGAVGNDAGRREVSDVGNVVTTAHDGSARADEQRKEDAIVSGSEFPGWKTILPRVPCGPACRQAWKLAAESGAKEYTHVRLCMYPDGGIGRFRLFGRAVPPSTRSDEVIDLAAAANGGVATDASDAYFSPPGNLLLPGRGVDMSDGWETKRSRAAGHRDWVVVRLGGGGGVVGKVHVDTAFYRGNYPVSCYVELWEEEEEEEGREWVRYGQEVTCEADKVHEITDAEGAWKAKKAEWVRLTIVPDGGVKRLRVWGTKGGGKDGE